MAKRKDNHVSEQEKFYGNLNGIFTFFQVVGGIFLLYFAWLWASSIFTIDGIVIIAGVIICAIITFLIYKGSEK